MIDVAAEGETPMIAMAASARIVEPMDAKRKWVFKTPQNDAQMSTAIVEHMTNNNVKTVAYIGFCRRLRRRLVERVLEDRRGAQDQDRRQRALQPHRYLGDRPGAQDSRRQAGCRADRRRRHAGRAAAEIAEGKGLQGHHLPDARRRQHRLPARLRQGLRGHLPAGRPGAGRRPVAGRQSGQEVGAWSM